MFVKGSALLQRNLFYPVRPAVLHLPKDIKQAGWDPSQGTKEQVLPTLSILFVKVFYIIYRKISNKLVGILHRARKNRYCPPYPFCLWSCSILSTRRSLVGILHRARKNRYCPPYPSLCSILSTRRFQTSWLGSFIVHVRTGMPTLSVLFVRLFYYLPDDFKQDGWDPSLRT